MDGCGHAAQEDTGEQRPGVARGVISLDWDEEREIFRADRGMECLERQVGAFGAAILFVATRDAAGFAGNHGFKI